MRNRTGIRVLVIAAFALSALLAGCARSEGPSVPSGGSSATPPSAGTTAALPASVAAALSGRTIIGSSAASAGPCTVGVAAGLPAAESGRRLTVVEWLSSDATRTLSGGKPWTAMKVVVRAQDGTVVFDSERQKEAERRSRGLRHGPAFIAPITAGIPVVQDMLVTLPNPGRYEVYEVYSFAVSKMTRYPTDLTPATTRSYAGTLPPVAVTVK